MINWGDIRTLGLTDYILLTETRSRLNLTGFQPGLDRVPVSKILVAQAKERGECTGRPPGTIHNILY